ncbi:aldehyde reductase [Lasiosphaeris hirsuta]|uniref:Aldehyde reductase n=1 Tax=Lasiosphaeris hirsuta TaxID=260670 RepID=A0AA40A137_9PEZI|nr:aldehyde reductase [Lasiosphaeris hirsuta]
MSANNTTIPTGSWILITGATGWLASHMIKEFLERGYRVRGTVRDLEKSSWLITDIFKAEHDRGDFELALVADLTTSGTGAYDGAVAGVAAIVNAASITSWDPDASKVIPPSVQGITSLLNAALKEASVRRFVHTSSCVAATSPMPGNTTRVERGTFNDAAVAMAWAEPTPETAPMLGPIVYMASKTEEEKTLWRFVDETRPGFTANTILPGSFMGQMLAKRHVQAPTAWSRHLYEGDAEALGRLPATFLSDIKDVTMLHVAAVLDPGVQNARIQAWGRGCNWNDILAVARRLYPQHEFIDDLPGMTRLSVTTDESAALRLLSEWTGQDGWRTLEQTVRDGIDSVIAWQGK